MSKLQCPDIVATSFLSSGLVSHSLFAQYSIALLFKSTFIVSLQALCSNLYHIVLVHRQLYRWWMSRVAVPIGVPCLNASIPH